MLTKRKGDILRIIVSDYVATGTPVSSEAIARKGLGISPATVRNEMTELEEAGYIWQPHKSAGRVPSEQGYRYYISSLMRESSLTAEEELLIRRQFHQASRELEEWIRLAAAIISGAVNSVAIVTLPKAARSRLKHLELVALHENLALLVLVLWEAKLKQQMLTLDEQTSQEELGGVARKLTSLYGGLSASGILALGGEGRSPVEARVTDALVQMMQAEEGQEYEEPYVEGVRHIFNQPEFAAPGDKAALIEVLDQKRLLRALIGRVVNEDGVRVVIGNENKSAAIQGCSVVITKYGVPGEITGAVGVIGPTRMRYDRAIPTVRFLSRVMSEMVVRISG